MARCVEQSLDLCLSTIETSGPENKSLSLAEAAKLTPYTKEYLGLLARQGKMGAIKIGKNWHVTSNTLKDYMTKSSRKEHKQPSKTYDPTKEL